MGSNMSTIAADMSKQAAAAMNAPTQPTALQNLLTSQQNYATNFRNNLGTTTNQNIYNNNVGINNQAMAQTQQAKNSNAARGMAYGGVNQGQVQGIQSQAQTQAAQQGGQIQTGLLNEANQLDMNAISTGLGMQQQQQQMQNAIYSQAMTEQQANNSMFGSAAGLITVAALASDARLKENIVKIGEENGFNIYQFNYKKDQSKSKYIGVLAQEVMCSRPDAVVRMDNYLAVNYNMIGVKFRGVS